MRGYHPHALVAFVTLYGVMYAAFGVASPFWPMFFETRGLSPDQIGTLLALGTLARLIAGPVIGRLSDIFGTLRAVLATCAAVAVASAPGLLSEHRYLPLLAISICQAAALAPITTIADALAVNSLGVTRQNTLNYGWVRGIGSAAFVAGTLLAGQVLNHKVSGLSAIVYMHAGLLSVVVIAAGLIPAPSILISENVKPIEAKEAYGGARQLLRNSAFRHVIIISALVLGSHAMHDAFAVIRWNVAGISPTTVSLLWSEAVVAEVVVFLLIGPLTIRRFGPQVAAILAIIAGVVRWTVMSQTTELYALALVQPLHGCTFALLHLACMHVISVSVSPLLAATAQSIYAFGSATASAVLTFLAGTLYGQLGASLFLVMALICALAIPFTFSLPSVHRNSTEYPA